MLLVSAGCDWLKPPGRRAACSARISLVALGDGGGVLWAGMGGIGGVAAACAPKPGTAPGMAGGMGGIGGVLIPGRVLGMGGGVFICPPPKPGGMGGMGGATLAFCACAQTFCCKGWRCGWAATWLCC